MAGVLTMKKHKWAKVGITIGLFVDYACMIIFILILHPAPTAEGGATIGGPWPFEVGELAPIIAMYGMILGFVGLMCLGIRIMGKQSECSRRDEPTS